MSASLEDADSGVVEDGALTAVGVIGVPMPSVLPMRNGVGVMDATPPSPWALSASASDDDGKRCGEALVGESAENGTWESSARKLYTSHSKEAMTRVPYFSKCLKFKRVL